MAVTLKRLKDAVVVDGKITEAAGLVIDCGDGIEQVLTAMVTPILKEVDVPVLDEDGKETGETVKGDQLVDTAVPIATLVQDAAAFQAAAEKYAEAYLRGKAIEAVLSPVKLEASAEVAALMAEK